MSLSGDLTLHSWNSTSETDNTTKIRTGCAGTGGYDDLDEGASVTVTDGNGKTLGVGGLDAGRVTNEKDLSVGTVSASIYDCVWSFTVPDLPQSDFYRVSITHRGTQTYSLAQVKAGQVHLSLGS